MKKFATRILALAIALCVCLLPAAALAEERNTASLTLSDVTVGFSGQSITLPIALNLTGGADMANERGFGGLSLGAGGNTAISATGALEDGNIKLYLDGMEYGFSIPMEQAMAIAQQSAGSMTSGMSPALFAAYTELMEAYTAMISGQAAETEVDPEALLPLLEKLNATMEDAGQAETTIFGETVTAQKLTFSVASLSLNEWMEAVYQLNPAGKQFMESYKKFFNQLLSENEAGLSFEDALNMVHAGLKGDIYATETAAKIDLTMDMSVEGSEEAFSIPMTIEALADPASAQVNVTSAMDMGDDRAVNLNVSTNAVISETGSAWNVSYAIAALEDGEAVMDFLLACDGETNGNAITFNGKLTVTSDSETMQAAATYTGESSTSAEADAFSGHLNLAAQLEGMDVSLDTDVLLTLSNLPEGELLTLPGTSVNPLEADEETMQQVMTDAQTALMNGLGILMQDPTLAGLFSNMLGGEAY